MQILHHPQTANIQNSLDNAYPDHRNQIDDIVTEIIEKSPSDFQQICNNLNLCLDKMDSELLQSIRILHSKFNDYSEMTPEQLNANQGLVWGLFEIRASIGFNRQVLAMNIRYAINLYETKAKHLINELETRSNIFKTGNGSKYPLIRVKQNCLAKSQRLEIFLISKV
jgi:hypothetical protein